MGRKHFNFWSEFSARPMERVLLYVVLTITVLMAGATYLILGNSHATRVSSGNAARAQSLKADIAALPPVLSIQPGKTSGLLDYVVTTRQDLAKQIDTKKYAPQKASGIFALRPKSQANDTRTDAHSKVLKAEKELLTQTASDLSALKKVIEYQPLADLADHIDTTNGTPERLLRTQEGLKKAVSYLKTSSLRDRDELAAQLQPFIPRSILVTDETKQQWSTDMLALQTSLVASIAAEDIQVTSYADLLDKITVSYQ
jgi:hypothetical protein